MSCKMQVVTPEVPWSENTRNHLEASMQSRMNAPVPSTTMEGRFAGKKTG
jgi:hypothetical protein